MPSTTTVSSLLDYIVIEEEDEEDALGWNSSWGSSWGSVEEYNDDDENEDEDDDFWDVLEDAETVVSTTGSEEPSLMTATTAATEAPVTFRPPFNHGKWNPEKYERRRGSVYPVRQ